MLKIRALLALLLFATFAMSGRALPAAAQSYPDPSTGTGLPPSPPDGSRVTPPMGLAAAQPVGIWSAFAQSVYHYAPDFWHPTPARTHRGSAPVVLAPAGRGATPGAARPRSGRGSAR